MGREIIRLKRFVRHNYACLSGSPEHMASLQRYSSVLRLGQSRFNSESDRYLTRIHLEICLVAKYLRELKALCCLWN